MPASSTTAANSTTAAPLIYSTARELARRVAAGEVPAREVVEAHLARIEEVDGRLNAVVVRRFDRARDEADAVDRARARGESLGPLAGVPITVKECFHVADTQATIGISHYVGRVSEADNPLVTRLRAAGAIVLGKTNLPQGMLMNETDSPVYGRCNNPWKLDRAPGGSSGGEAAIIAAGGSALGLGNDVGGSIRQPAHSCGIHGLKPTSGRLTNVGTFENLRGLEALVVQPGPLARSVDDLALAFGILAAPGLEQIDWQVPPVALGDPASVRIEGLRVGIWCDDGFFAASPAVRRAVEQSGQALVAAGAEIVPFSPPDVPEAMRLYFGLLSADGGADLARLLGRSRRDWRVRRLLLAGHLPRKLRRPICWLLERCGQRYWGHLIRSIGPWSADAFWQLTYQRREYVAQFLRRLDAGRIDCLVCPPHALPALTHGSTAHLTAADSYAALFNLLGLPAGVVAATRVGPGEQSDRPANWDLMERTARDVERHSAGLPVGVQVAARHWREDIVLAAMGVLESHFRARDDYPARPPI